TPASANAVVDGAMVRPWTEAPVHWGSTAATSSRSGAPVTASHTVAPMRPPAPNTPTRVMRPRVAAVAVAFAVALALAVSAVVLVPARPAAAAGAGAQRCLSSPPDSPGDFDSVGRTRNTSYGIGDITSAVRLP